MAPEEIEEHKLHFDEIIYDNLLKVLETRTKKPVSNFAKMILQDAGLNKDGDPIPDKEAPLRKDRKKVSKGDLDDEKPMKKSEKKKSGGEDSAEEDLKAEEKTQKNEEARKAKKAAKKAEEGGVPPKPAEGAEVKSAEGEQ